MRPVARVLVPIVSGLLAVGVMAAPAHAATVMVQSQTPVPGSSTRAVTSVSITFDVNVAVGSTLSVSSGPSACSTAAQVAAKTLTCSFPSGGGKDGDYVATYSAQPAAGGETDSGKWDFTIDNTAPPAPPSLNITPTAYRANSTDFTVSGLTQRGSDSISVVVSDGTTSAERKISASGSASSGSFTTTFSPSQMAMLSDGSLTATATATDLAGNTGPAKVLPFTKDTVLPVVDMLAATAVKKGATTTTVTGRRSESAVVVVTATGAGSSKTVTVPAGTGSFSVDLDLSGLGDGPVSITALPTDTAGNQGAGTAVDPALTKDTVAPIATISAANDTNATQKTSTVTGTRSESSSIRIVATGSAGKTVEATVPAAVGDWSTTLDLSTLADGPITIVATPTDTAGNVGDPVSRSVTKTTTTAAATNVGASDTDDTTKVITVTGSAPNASKVRIIATDKNGATVEDTVVPGADGSFSKTLDLTSLADGTISISVTPIDKDNNVGPVTKTSIAKDPSATTVTGLSATETSPTKQVTTVTGTRSRTSTVLVTVTDASGKSVTVTVPKGAGAFSQALDLSSLGAGPIKITAVPTNTRGKQGATATVSVGRSVNGSGPGVALDAPTGKAVAGKQLTLKGTVTRADSSVAPGRVTITGTDDTGRATTVATVTPAADGTFTLLLKPLINTTYTASYAGDTRNPASTSAVRKVLVKARIHAKLTRGALGQRARVRGTVSPAKAGQLVTLVRVDPKTKARVSYGSVRLKANSTFTFAVKLPRGKAKMIVTIGDTVGNLGNSGKVRTRRK